MITVLLEQIIQILNGWIESFNNHAEAVEESLTDLNNTASDIELNTDPIPEIRDNTGAIITPITQIKTNTDSIKTDVTQIKTDTGIIKNNANSIATSAGAAAAFAEDCATNTLDIKDKITTIASDTTQLRANSAELNDMSDKIYEAIKWSLADKYIDETESGPSPMSFDTDIADDLISCNVELVAHQSGSGDPSPDNVRAISGYSNMNLTVNGSTITIALGDTYYNGYLDVISGVLKITNIKANTTSSNVTTYNGLSSNGVRFTSALNDSYRFAKSICNMANIATDTTYTPGIMAVGINNNQIYWFSIIDILGLADLQAFKDWLELNPVDVIYELATPIEVQLTTQQIAAIKGVNIITSDTNGEIEVTYKESIKHYLDKQQ